MKRLILTRHAKSSWDDPLVADHDRPLNNHGRTAAAELGRWLASRGYIPACVLSSDSRRAHETFTSLAPAFAELPELYLIPALYHASPDVMMHLLRQAEADAVMLIGHNPAIAELAHQLVARTPLTPEFRRYPTGATLIVDFTTDNWADIGFGRGVTLDFIVPDNLPGLTPATGLTA